MRNLTSGETAVLAHVVVDPAAWWTHAQSAHRDPEAALAAKVARWQAEYDAASAQEGYQTRAEREEA